VTRILCTVAALALVPGCTGDQNVFAAAGPQSERIHSLLRGYFGILLAVFAVVVILLAWALVRGSHNRPPADPGAARSPQSEPELLWFVSTAVAVTAAILLVLLVWSVRTGSAVAAFAAQDPLTIEITGHQWWWELRYLNPDASRIVTTANELHIPVGQPVRLKLVSHDVIHSFWVPNLHGKKDLIPGYENTDHIQADKPGIYRGQCAEFCGVQHAHMALVVVAEPPAQFAAWVEAQLQPAAEPATPEARRGREVFLRSACPMCHAVAGTDAHARVAPELTHLAGRQTLAAGTLPNTTGNLAGWILDPQGVKPGNHMPPNDLRPGDLQDLLAWLTSLR
jgi:cytochrome c oxidase subunit 2